MPDLNLTIFRGHMKNSMHNICTRDGVLEDSSWTEFYGLGLEVVWPCPWVGPALASNTLSSNPLTDERRRASAAIPAPPVTVRNADTKYLKNCAYCPSYYLFSETELRSSIKTVFSQFTNQWRHCSVMSNLGQSRPSFHWSINHAKCDTNKCYGYNT